MRNSLALATNTDPRNQDTLDYRTKERLLAAYRLKMAGVDLEGNCEAWSNICRAAIDLTANMRENNFARIYFSAYPFFNRTGMGETTSLWPYQATHCNYSPDHFWLTPGRGSRAKDGRIVSSLKKKQIYTFTPKERHDLRKEGMVVPASHLGTAMVREDSFFQIWTVLEIQNAHVSWIIQDDSDIVSSDSANEGSESETSRLSVLLTLRMTTRGVKVLDGLCQIHSGPFASGGFFISPSSEPIYWEFARALTPLVGVVRCLESSGTKEKRS